MQFFPNLISLDLKTEVKRILKVVKTGYIWMQFPFGDRVHFRIRMHESAKTNIEIRALSHPDN